MLPGGTLARENLKNVGLHVYLNYHDLYDQYKTIMFIGKLFVPLQAFPGHFFPNIFKPKVHGYMERANVNFMREHMNYRLVERPVKKV